MESRNQRNVGVRTQVPGRERVFVIDDVETLEDIETLEDTVF